MFSNKLILIVEKFRSMDDIISDDKCGAFVSPFTNLLHVAKLRESFSLEHEIIYQNSLRDCTLKIRGIYTELNNKYYCAIEVPEIYI